jgi:hypothetical protein
MSAIDVAVAINCWRTANGGNGENSFELGEFFSDFCLLISAFCLRKNLTKKDCEQPIINSN